MDTALIYSRMCLIRKMKHLCFTTKRNFAIPFPSVPNSFSRLCVCLRTKHRRQMKAFISIFSEFGITFTAEVRLDVKNVLICVLKNVI